MQQEVSKLLDLVVYAWYSLFNLIYPLIRGSTLERRVDIRGSLYDTYAKLGQRNARSPIVCVVLANVPKEFTLCRPNAGRIFNSQARTVSNRSQASVFRALRPRFGEGIVKGSPNVRADYILL